MNKLARIGMHANIIILQLLLKLLFTVENNKIKKGNRRSEYVLVRTLKNESIESDKLCKCTQWIYEYRAQSNFLINMTCMRFAVELLFYL